MSTNPSLKPIMPNASFQKEKQWKRRLVARFFWTRSPQQPQSKELFMAKYGRSVFPPSPTNNHAYLDPRGGDNHPAAANNSNNHCPTRRRKKKRIYILKKIWKWTTVDLFEDKKKRVKESKQFNNVLLIREEKHNRKKKTLQNYWRVEHRGPQKRKPIHLEVLITVQPPRRGRSHKTPAFLVANLRNAFQVLFNQQLGPVYIIPWWELRVVIWCRWRKGKEVEIVKKKTAAGPLGVGCSLFRTEQKNHLPSARINSTVEISGKFPSHARTPLPQPAWTSLSLEPVVFNFACFHNTRSTKRKEKII